MKEYYEEIYKRLCEVTPIEWERIEIKIITTNDGGFVSGTLVFSNDEKAEEFTDILIEKTGKPFVKFKSNPFSIFKDIVKTMEETGEKFPKKISYIVTRDGKYTVNFQDVEFQPVENCKDEDELSFLIKKEASDMIQVWKKERMGYDVYEQARLKRLGKAEEKRKQDEKLLEEEHKKSDCLEAIRNAKNVEKEVNSPKYANLGLDDYIKCVLDSGLDVNSGLRAADSSTKARTEALSVAVNGSLPKDFEKLYERFDGEKEYISFVAGFEMLSMDKVISEYKNLKEITKNIKGLGPDTNWIPFAHDASRCFIAIDLSPFKDGKIGQVIGIDFDENVSYKFADSLGEFYGLMIKWFDEGKLVLMEEDGNTFVAEKSGHIFNNPEDFCVKNNWGI